MRQLVLQFYVSLDMYSCEVDNGLMDIMMSMDDDRQEEYFVNKISQAGTHIMGGGVYQDMAAYWPTSDHPSADAMNKIPKVVFSRSLQSADWPESRIASGDTAEEIAKLKAEPGGEILAHGGNRFVRSLIKLGVIDQYRLWVLPAAAGRGEPLFTDLDHPLRLRLLESTAFPESGILELIYRPADRQDPQTAQSGANP